ncbi:type II toxin-antitoxin system HipA family toxin [Salinibius halmophilus]|uniref:type II toxin-antitoxin system HipA family toxin n=1 Tax=Salinibius halmophilus TaxID=1853216 RepID=UPI000E673BEA|nr:type II toxin-antitoxin system HipA family toxin [Salinibius halmophilus]
MAFSPVSKLAVYRTLSSGNKVLLGELAQNRQGVFFQYDTDYLNQYGNASPFTIKADTSIQLAPPQPHLGLHGLFGDSMPDGWGMLLQDRAFRQAGVLPQLVTAMDRLAFVGDHAIGALSFSPESSFRLTDDDDVNVFELGQQAQSIFDGQTDEVLAALVAAGSSGGARPKAQLYWSRENTNSCSTRPKKNDDAWIVKFTSANLALGHQEGICEAVYLKLAEKADLNPPEFDLLSTPKGNDAPAWLAVKRFDFINNGTNPSGRLLMHSACGLLDADFRSPSLDYEMLIKAAGQLCKSPAAAKLIFRRAIFNLFASNQDDHSKNWAFLQNDKGQWQPAPFYDVTFSPHPFNEHATAFCGYGKTPPLKVIQKLANSAGYKNWQQAQIDIQQVVDVVATFSQVAFELDVEKKTVKEVQEVLDQRRHENKHLL